MCFCDHLVFTVHMLLSHTQKVSLYVCACVCVMLVILWRALIAAAAKPVVTRGLSKTREKKASKLACV